MNGKLVMIITLAVITMVFGSQALSRENVESLRGMTPIEDPSATPESKRWEGKSDPIAREFAEQPPLIPHKSQSQKINLEQNKCLTCHGLANYEEKGATRLSEAHFRDRGGNTLDSVSPARYFCTQCHVEQRDVAPLVDNEFKSLEVTQ
jgi:cytochrome c-type protein NapB